MPLLCISVKVTILFLKANKKFRISEVQATLLFIIETPGVWGQAV